MCKKELVKGAHRTGISTGWILVAQIRDNSNSPEQTERKGLIMAPRVVSSVLRMQHLGKHSPSSEVPHCEARNLPTAPSRTY